MGIAIIKGEFGANALGRTMHNLTPKDPNRRKSFTDNDLKNTIWEEDNGVYKVVYINLGQATQHYKYVLCDSQGNELLSLVGVHINLINGNITLDSNYDGSAVYAKVIPIVDDYYNITINTTAVLVKLAEEIQDTYSLEVAYHGELGLTAEAHSIAALTSFVLKKNGTTVIANVTEMDAAVRAGTLTVSASVTTLGVGSWISVKEVRNLLLAKNTGAVRLADVLVTCTYEGKSITDSFTVVLLPNELESVDNDAVYSGSTAYGTTISYTDITATGHYTNGDTISIHPQENGISPSTILAGGHEYTITFANNITKTITIVGQSLISSKAYISGLPRQSAEGAADGPYPGPTAGTHQWPLHVLVTRVGGTVEEKTFAEYLTLPDEKETYSAPKLTFANTIEYDTMATVDSNGTLTYDLSADNYVYDKNKTKITSLTLNCTSNSSLSASYDGDIKINADRIDYSYFDNNFTAIDLSTQAGSEYLLECDQAFYVESETQNLNYVTLDKGGSVYKLKPAEDYYFRFKVKDSMNFGYGAIISLTPNTSVLTDENTSGVKVRYIENTNFVLCYNKGRYIYVHHTPEIENGKTYEDYVTYIVGGNATATYFDVELLIPNNNN